MKKTSMNVKPRVYDCFIGWNIKFHNDILVDTVDKKCVSGYKPNRALMNQSNDQVVIPSQNYIKGKENDFSSTPLTNGRPMNKIPHHYKPPYGGGIIRTSHKPSKSESFSMP